MGFFDQWSTIPPQKGILLIPRHSIFRQIDAGTVRKILHAASLTFLLDSRSPSGREPCSEIHQGEQSRLGQLETSLVGCRSVRRHPMRALQLLHDPDSVQTLGEGAAIRI